VTRPALAALATVAALGGCTITDDRYSVDAFAELQPLGAAVPQITGRLEVLSAAQRDDGFNGNAGHAIAAYHVQLPADAAPWIRLWAAPSCDTPPEQAMLFQDLGLIRRVGDSTHFFDRDVEIGGHTVDIDIGTATSAATLADMPFYNLLNLLAVAQAPAPPDGATTTPQIGSQFTLVGGAWLACGNFVRTVTR
jgi:hypothetical protein